MTRRNSEAGQSLLMIAFSMVAFIAMLGLAIDMGYFRYMQRQLQTAADNAALAGAIQIPYALNGTSVQTAALGAAAEDNFADGVNGVQVNVCQPPNTAGAYGNCPATPFNGSGKIPVCTVCAQVTVTNTQVPTFFSQNFGAPKHLTLSATAVAEGSLNCIYGLDTASSGAISLDFAIVNSTCGVADNSNLSGLVAELCAPSIELKGSDTIFIGGTSCNFGFRSAAPVKITTAASDPLASLAAPAVTPMPTTCTGKPGINTVNTNGVTITPTPVYCGGTLITGGATGITVTPGTYFGSPAFSIRNATVTFQPGTYYIVSRTAGGPGILLNGLNLGANTVSFGPGTYTVYGGIQDNSLFGTAVNWNNSSGTSSMFILDGGGLTLLGNSGNSGSVGQYSGGVTFYNTGTAGAGAVTSYGIIQSYFDFSAGFCGSNCQLSAPTSGPYSGILFFNDRSNTATMQCAFGIGNQAAGCFSGNTNFNTGQVSHAGAYYFPNSKVSFNFDFGIGAPYTFLIAKDISWLAAFTFNHDFRTLPNGSQVAEGTAVLVQ